jgi:hypothetical protein
MPFGGVYIGNPGLTGAAKRDLRRRNAMPSSLVRGDLTLRPATFPRKAAHNFVPLGTL